MPVELVLNELSWPSPESSILHARSMMSALVRVIVTASEIGADKCLRTKASIIGAELVRGYPLARWRNDREVDQVERQFFRGVIAKAPFIGESEDERSVREKAFVSEYRYAGSVADGLGAAHLLRGIAVSFQSHPVWDCSICHCDVIVIEEDGVVDESVSVPHASAAAQMRGHREFIQQRLSAEVTTGGDLWDRREQLFPKLLFCAEVEAQLRALNEKELLNSVVDRLFDLESYCKTWTAGGFDPDGVPCKVTPEGEATLTQYGDYRVFTCPENGPVQFSWHARVTPWAWRVYFDPRPIGRLCVGYIGPHLPTKKFPN